ncbi:hypothetical protein GCM10011414_01750 [Croceivirga lutea]|uniref:POTRA domain-containing protein n=1 Tax=Croceivirga lutea TaxID=1775167 RepID=UPI001639F27B|nr:POTRA domain-containing protein [Croceivirga lutea]GGG36073.1 hypothetical protein GCM10011414_01750 [Croceivirga lutea]
MIKKVVLLLLFLAQSLGSQELVSEFEIKGNRTTKTTLVKRISQLKLGQRLDSTVLHQDINRLKQLPSITHAFFKVVPLSNSEVKVIYDVEENFTIIPFANIYTSSNDEFAFRVGLQEFNFLGENITLGAFYQYDIFNSYGLNIRAPFLFSKKVGLALNYQDLTTQEPVFLENGTADYKYNNHAIELLGLYQINNKNQLELGFNIFIEDYQYLFGATNPNVPQELKVDKFLLKLLYNYQKIDYYYYFLDGFKSNLNLQMVTSSSEQLPDFWIGFNDFAFYKRVGQKGNWATRLRFGLASNFNTPFAPFAVDNNLNIRGVGNIIDRGTAAIVLNTEYRHTLIEKDWFVMQSNIFIDGGSWRNPGGDLGDFTEKQNLRIYPGIGIRFMHKRIFNAIFRIDYGYGVTSNSTKGFVFGIGQYF